MPQVSIAGEACRYPARNFGAVRDRLEAETHVGAIIFPEPKPYALNPAQGIMHGYRESRENPEN